MTKSQIFSLLLKRQQRFYYAKRLLCHIESFKSLSMRHSHNCTIRCDTTSRGHTFAHRLRFYYPQLYCHKQRAHIGHRHSVLSPLMTICRERGRVESLDELCVESFVLMRELLSPPWDRSEIHQLSINTTFFSNPFTLCLLLLFLTPDLIYVKSMKMYT